MNCNRTGLEAALGFILTATSVFAQGFNMIDDGTGTRQVVADGAVSYVLKDNGNIFSHEAGRWTMVDDGVGTTMIAGSRGNLYAQKSDGAVWHLKFGQWRRIGNPGTRQLVADGGLLYTLENNDDVYAFNLNNSNNWVKIDNGTGTRMLAADLTTSNVALFCLKNSGTIFQYQGQNWLNQGVWQVVDDGSGTRQIEASGSMLYALKDNGNIWRMAGSWNRIDDGSGTKQVEADGRMLFVLKDSGNIWMLRDEQWTKIDDGAGTRQVEASEGRLLVLKDNGNVFEANASALGSPMAPASTRVDNFNAIHGN